MGGFDLRIRKSGTMRRADVFIQLRAEGDETGTGTACNLVIDQFVTIWRFVYASSVNVVYPGPSMIDE